MRFGETTQSREDLLSNSLLSSSKRYLRCPHLLFISPSKISIDQTGPFWPVDYPMKYPSPRYLSRAFDRIDSKAYHHRFLDTIHSPTYDNQPAIFKYTDNFKHSTVVYDMEKSTRQQQIKANDSEQSCPQLIFESRFEGGNLRQVKRV